MKALPHAPRALLLAVVALVATSAANAQNPDGSPSTAPVTRPAFDPDVVAVAPFDVLMPSLALWREGMVDVLSRRLDGAGPLRAVSASAVIRGWTGRADPTSARRLGQRTRAQFAVFGEMVGAGMDSVRISASVMDVKTGRVTGTIEAKNSSSRMDLLADTLTLRLLAVLGRARGGGVLSTVDLDTHSMLALKAYLEGEQLFRAARHDSAAVMYRSAIALDSGFMQARRRLAWAAQWRCVGDTPDFTLLDDVLRRIKTTRGLSLRDSISLQIDSINAAWVRRGAMIDVDSSMVRELVAATSRGVRAFPRDAEFWHLYGEALGAVWPRTPASIGRSVAAFERAIVEDPGLAPPFMDAADYATMNGDYSLARRYLREYLKAGVGGDCAVVANLMTDLLPGGGLTGAVRAKRVQGIPSGQLWPLIRVFDTLVDPDETAVALLRIALERRVPAGRTTDTATAIRGVLSRVLRFRGHLSAGDSATTGPIQGFLNRMFIGSTAALLSPASRPWTIDKAPADPIHPYGFWLVADYARVRDTASLDLFAQRADSLYKAVPPHVTETENRFGGPNGIFQSDQRRKTLAYGATIARAARSLVTGDTTAAVRDLKALPDTACLGCFQHISMLTRVYTAQGKYEAALPYYRLLVRYPRDARQVFWTFERALAMDHMKDRKGAIANYQYVIDAWPHPDAELAGYVTQARAALKRLH